MSDGDRAGSGSSSSAPRGGPAGVHRLIDMLVEEVSLVDRPANLQRFLVVKRESEMPEKTVKAKTLPPRAKTPKKPGKAPPKGPTAEEREDQDTEKAKKKPAKDAETEERDDQATEKGKKTPPKAPPPFPPAADKDKGGKGKDGKAAKAAPPKTPEEEEQEDEEEEEGEEEEAEEEEPAGKPPKKAEKDLEGEQPGEDEGQGDETADDDETPLRVALAALDSLTQAVELLSETPDAAGEQLAAVAQDIRDAADAISSAAGFEAEEEEEEGAEPEAQEASISGLVSSIQEMLTRIETLTEALEASTNTQPPVPTVTTTTETQSPPDFAGTLAEVAQSMKSLDTLVRGQASRIDRLEKRSGVPNSNPPGERTTKREPAEEESWPLDLNRPRDRGSVDKSLSFHDPNDA